MNRGRIFLLLLPLVRSIVTTQANKCTFESNLCGWKESDQDVLDWGRTAGMTTSRKSGNRFFETGPVTDHTLRNNNGFYMYLETTGRDPGQYADLLSIQYNNKPRKLQFAYYMHGKNMGSLQVFVWVLNQGYPKDGSNNYIWAATGEKGDKWLEESLNIPAQPAPYKIIFRAIVGDSTACDVAIDDVTVSEITANGGGGNNAHVTAASALVTTKVTTTVLFQCNFTYSCGWTHNNRDIMQWFVSSSPTPSSLTGANRDHTSGYGKFAFVQSYDARGRFKVGTQAVTTTPVLKVTAGCQIDVNFYYNMYGWSMGSLKFRVHGDSHDLWSKSGQQNRDGNTWTQGNFSFSTDSVAPSFKLDLVGDRGNGAKSDMCVDDVTVTQTCTETVTIPPPTGPVQTTELLSCDFESQCTFNQSDKDDFDWSRNHGSTPSSGTGPNNDHTKGNNNGYYIYIETSSHAQHGISPSDNPGDAAVLISPLMVVQPSCHAQLTFFYNMYGDSTGTLEVRMHDDGAVKWTKSGQQNDDGTKWSQATVNFPENKSPSQQSFKFEIVGIRGNGYHGDIAIDDVKVLLVCPGLSVPIAAGAGGGALVALIVVITIICTHKKKLNGESSRASPVDDSVSYHSVENGVQLSQHNEYVTMRQIADVDSGLGDFEPEYQQPRNNSSLRSSSSRV